MDLVRWLGRLRLDVVLGSAVAAVGAGVLVGWLVRWDVALQLLPDRAPMQFNTALCFVASGVALAWRGRPGAPACAGLALGVGLLSLSQYVFAIDLGIDQLLLQPHLTVHTSDPGRMAPMTAIGFIGLGGILLGEAWLLSITRRGSALLGVGGSALLALGLANLLGYALGVETPFGWQDATYMAIHTAACFVLLGIGTLQAGWRQARVEEEATLPRWSPVAATLVGLALAISTWQILLERERDLLENVVRRDLDRVTGEMRVALDGARLAVRRMKHRLEQTARPDEEAWRRDAERYLEDHPYYESIGVRLAEDRVWNVGGVAEEDPEVLCALLRGRVRPDNDPLATTHGGRLRLCSPVGSGGWLLATVSLERLLESEFDADWRRDHRIEVFAGAERLQIRGGSPAEPGAVVRTGSLTLGDRRWDVRLTPSPEHLASLGSQGPEVGLATGVALAMLLGASFSLARRSEGRAYRLEALRASLDRRVEAATVALAASEARYEDLYQHAPDFHLQVDAATGRIRDCNETFARRMGRRRDELVGAPATDIYHPDSRKDAEAAFRIFRERGEVTQAGLVLQAADGSTIPVDLKATAFRGPGGDVLFSRSVLRDVSEVRALQSLLFESRSREILGRLAGGVAHDFNNLLTVILGSLEVALDALPEGHAAREPLDEMHAASLRASELIRDLLAVGRRQMLSPRTRELPDLVEELQPVLRRALPESVALQLDHRAAPGPVVRVDVAQFEQLLLNLVLNARDAMPQGGVLAIETGRTRFRDPRDDDGDGEGLAPPRGLLPGRYGWLTVSDTGVGIAPELLGQIFEPFFTTKAESSGSGLGLASARGFAEQSGGLLEVESTPGEGTTFRFYLPETDARPAVVAPAAPAPVSSLEGSETILVVDDQEALRVLLRRLLERKGYRVLDAASASEALSVVRAEPLDLVLTDVVMPERSGPELAEEIRSQRPGLPVLFMSGYAESTVLEHGLEADDLMAKPFRPVELWRRVREVLNASAAEARG